MRACRRSLTVPSRRWPHTSTRDSRLITARRNASRGGFAAALGIAALAAACRIDTARYPVEPPRDTTVTDTTDTTGGAVRRATLTLTVTVSESDSAVIRALALPSDRRLAGVTVTLRRDPGSSTLTATTDSAGQATFTDLLEGNFTVAALRPLTGVEVARLDPSDRDVTGLAGGATIAVVSPTTSRTLLAYAGRRGSLVISELDRLDYRIESAFYLFANFLELYNNSDTTIYLDGKTVGKGLPGWADYAAYPCANEEPYRMDSLGIWASWFYRFPGTGREYPLAPGRTVVLATDAIDHSTLDPRLPNLSFARFEFRGAADVDNPRAVDMLSIGTRDGGTPLGHGLIFTDLRTVVFVAEYVDTATIPKQRPPSYTFQFARIPRDLILDVLTIRLADFTQPERLCGPAVHPVFDRQMAALLNQGGTDWRTAQRKTASTLPDGRKLLLRTKTSAVDFEARVRTPGSIP